MVAFLFVYFWIFADVCQSFVFHQQALRIQARAHSLYGSFAYGSYLERMVERKKIEVDSLLRRHQDPNDPLVMRMSYMASENKYVID